MLQNQVSAAERLNKYWLAYEKDCEEAEMSINTMESELAAVIADTEPEDLHTCLDRLQVCAKLYKLISQVKHCQMISLIVCDLIMWFDVKLHINWFHCVQAAKIFCTVYSCLICGDQ